MSKIDWSKAPNDATHCLPDAVDPWRRLADGYWDAWCQGRWVTICDPTPELYVGRPVEWDGRGLPPANTMVEIRNVSAQTEWSAARVVFASRNVIVWDWAGEPAINGLCTSYAHAVEVRPIRTPEQIAKDERSKACDEMFGVILKMTSGDPNNRSDILEALYDAGYRKQKD